MIETVHKRIVALRHVHKIQRLGWCRVTLEYELTLVRNLRMNDDCSNEMG